MRMISRASLALAAIVSTGAARAESAKMSGIFVADARAVAQQRSIAVGRFDGRDGAAFALALEQNLAGGYFDLVATGRGRADAVVSGVVSTDVQESNWTRTEQKCVEKDPGGKCIAKQEVKTPCRRRVIDLTIDVRVVADRLLYSAEKPRRDEVSWCQAEQPSRTTENAIRAMIAQSADDIARSFVPQTRDYSIRFRESTKGMPKDVEKVFKAAVKQSQRDIAGACTAWGAIDTGMPGNASVTFNLGLCAEAVRDYAKADDLYRRAAPLLSRGSEADEGVDRIAKLVAAREDARVRR